MSGSLWCARLRFGGGVVASIVLRASTWHKARARASVLLGQRYGHARCAPELLEVTS